MTGMALGCIGATSGFGSHVTNAKTLPSTDGLQIPANAATGASVTLNQHSSRPAFGLGSAKLENGTKHR